MSLSPVFIGVRAARSLVFCVVFCRSLFVFIGVRAARSLVFCVVFCRALFVFIGVRAARSLVFCVVFCRSLFALFVLFLLSILLSVLLRFTDSDYPFCIFKHFSHVICARYAIILYFLLSVVTC